MGANAYYLVSNLPSKGAAKNLEIHLKVAADSEIIQQITNIVKKHNLKMKEDKDEVISCEQ